MENIDDRLAEMWRKSREDAGKSQEYLAKKLGVSKKTIQNWESGYSSPSQAMGFKWFNALNLQPMPYYLNALYPQDFSHTDSVNDEYVEESLIKYIKSLRPADKRKLLFVIYGDHGSAFNELIEMLTAHFHTPDECRLVIAQNILTNYLLSEANNSLVATNKIMPNIGIFKRAILNKRNKLLGTDD